MDFSNIHKTIKSRLSSFYESKKIPHIIFHGPSGTGKRTLVDWFLHLIYSDNKPIMKSNIMLVNCAHGKGIKFIRDDLKFFAKSNIQSNQGILFKTIVLLNADFLTMDAQSALRRCIELFSTNTRFFIIVENKNKLLNPILSRFCEIYIPETYDSNLNIINLHNSSIKKQSFYVINKKLTDLSILKDCANKSHIELLKISTELYDEGICCLDILEWIKTPEKSSLSEYEISRAVLCFDKVRPEYRCEKLLMLYMLDYIFLRSNRDLKNIGFI
jgi:hypothetical protein